MTVLKIANIDNLRELANEEELYQTNSCHATRSPYNYITNRQISHTNNEVEKDALDGWVGSPEFDHLKVEIILLNVSVSSFFKIFVKNPFEWIYPPEKLQ